MVGQVGTQLKREIWREAMPAGVKACLGKNGDDEPAVAVVIAIFLPVEIVLESGTAAHIQPRIELITMTCCKSGENL